MTIGLVLLLAQSAAAAPPAPGEKVFLTTCAVGYCHGVGGVANRGPRLRGRTFESGYVERTVRHGLPNSAMPAFEGKLSEPDLTAVVAYVNSIAAPPTPGGATVAPPSDAPKAAAEMPAEFAPGRALFHDSTREVRCAMCHLAGTTGLKIGPDVVAAARNGAEAVVSAARSSHATQVRRAVLHSGETLPVWIADEMPAMVRVFDLSGMPPVLRTLRRADIVSLEPDPAWSHARVAAAYSDAELAEIARYLVWLASAR